MPESEDPRILSREDFEVEYDGNTVLMGHDLAQRERIATLEADNRRLREALRGLLNHVNTIECLGEWEAADINRGLRKKNRALIDEVIAAARAALQPAAPHGKDGNGNQFADAGKMVQPAAPICKTCGGKKRVMRVIKQYEDAYAEHSHLKFSDCPDCAAAPQLSGEAGEKE